MSNPAASLMVAVVGPAVCVKISGRANFASSVDFKTLVNEMARRGHRRFVLDLVDCLVMDSTFLGVLAGLAIKASKAPETAADGLFELLNPSPRVSDLLENLGVAHLFKFRTGENPLTAAYQPVASAEATRAEMTGTSIAAHQTLIQVNPENAPKFKDVIQFLAEDLKRQETAAL
ncbi:MAG: anti-sigma factor antagonist [Pedosphaera sp.]|nr:anti-sigma factor antagonist [Pedosphaera sp.]MST00698.1 anti-sigma factor antagonist [Pedosphaera sp.]